MSDHLDTVAALPHALGVEKSVLSVLLQWPDAIEEAPDLTADHFHLPAHRKVFSLFCELVSAGKLIDLVSFTQILNERDLLERIGGPSALCDIYNHQLSKASFRSHIDILTIQKARRMAIATGAEIMRVAYESDLPEDILEATSGPITAIHDLITGNGPGKSTKSVLLECFQRFDRLCRGETTPMGIETSLTDINQRFRGLHSGHTVVISAYPGGGKTTLAGQFAMDAVADEHNTLFVSLEVGAQDLMNRMLAYVARLPGKAITDPREYCREQFNSDHPTKYLMDAMKAAARKISQAPFHIENMHGASVYQIAACVRRAHRKSPLKVVVVDFAQRIRPVPETARSTKEQQLSHASNYLADLSKELGFCLLLPSQLNKEGAAKHAESINEDADLHLQILQDRSGTAPTFKHIGIAVAKDRHHGHDGIVLPIVLDGPMIRFIPKM